MTTATVNILMPAPAMGLPITTNGTKLPTQGFGDLLAGLTTTNNEDKVAEQDLMKIAKQDLMNLLLGPNGEQALLELIEQGKLEAQDDPEKFEQFLEQLATMLGEMLGKLAAQNQILVSDIQVDLTTSKPLPDDSVGQGAAESSLDLEQQLTSRASEYPDQNLPEQEISQNVAMESQQALDVTDAQFIPEIWDNAQGNFVRENVNRIKSLLQQVNKTFESQNVTKSGVVTSTTETVESRQTADMLFAPVSATGEGNASDDKNPTQDDVEKKVINQIRDVLNTAKPDIETVDVRPAPVAVTESTVNQPSLTMQVKFDPEQLLKAAHNAPVPTQSDVDMEERIQRLQVVRQVVEKTQWVLRNGEGRVVMQLHPVELGQVDLQVDYRGKEIHVTMRVENEAVRQVVESQLPQLRESLEKGNMTLEKVDVSIERERTDVSQQQEQQGNGQRNHKSRSARFLAGAMQIEIQTERDTGRRLGYNTMEVLA